LKRAFDIASASIGLVLTSPIVLLAAAFVKLDSPGPVFYLSPRVGRDGRPFEMVKLRSMQVGADTHGPPVTVSADPRVTRAGRLLRRTKIDELPQLVNVLKGDMSLVGPRPEHPEYVKLYTPEQRRVLSVRPGITGAAVIVFVDEESMLTGSDPEASYRRDVMPKKLALDLDYVEHHGFQRDLSILLATAGIVIRRIATRPMRGASEPRP